MAGEGEILKKTREEKKLSYAEVEEATKIRSWYLKALENEDYNVLPGRAYTKGFLRTYSKFLGLDPDEIIALYKSSLAAEPSTDLKPPLSPIQNTMVWFKPLVLIIMAVIAIIIVIGITYFTKLSGNEQNSDYDLPLLPETPGIEQFSEPNNDNESVSQPEQTQDEVYDGLVAELNFHEKCWLQVKADGVLVQDGTLEAGTTKIFKASDRIEFVTIGNAGGFTLKLNGKDYPPLGKSGEVIHDYVITEDTLKNL